MEKHVEVESAVVKVYKIYNEVSEIYLVVSCWNFSCKTIFSVRAQPDAPISWKIVENDKDLNCWGF